MDQQAPMNQCYILPPAPGVGQLAQQPLIPNQGYTAQQPQPVMAQQVSPQQAALVQAQIQQMQQAQQVQYAPQTPMQGVYSPPQGTHGNVVGIAGLRQMEMGQMGAQIQQQQPRGIFGRLKETLINLVTEEVEPEHDVANLNHTQVLISDDRPIGLAHLSRNTFQNSFSQNPVQSSTSEAGRPIMFRQSRPTHDYSFNQLVNPEPQQAYGGQPGYQY